jgi:hypothetical protein
MWNLAFNRSLETSQRKNANATLNIASNTLAYIFAQMGLPPHAGQYGGRFGLGPPRRGGAAGAPQHRPHRRIGGRRGMATGPVPRGDGGGAAAQRAGADCGRGLGEKIRHRGGVSRQADPSRPAAPVLEGCPVRGVEPPGLGAGGTPASVWPIRHDRRVGVCRAVRCHRAGSMRHPLIAPTADRAARAWPPSAGNRRFGG